jgi:hypothetical protein
LQAQFGVGCSLRELRSVALVVADCVGLTLSRSAKRTLPGLIQWFDQNWSVLTPLLSLVCLLDEEGTPITLARELLEMS